MANTVVLTTVEDLLNRNAEKVHISQPSITEMPLQKIFIVSCCDPRIDPVEILGLQKWDAVVTRSAAGRIRPQFQNLLFLDQMLKFSDIMIIHHTDCSASIIKNDDVRQTLKERAPENTAEIDKLVLPAFDNLEQSVRDDVEFVTTSALVRKELADRAHGYIHDLQTGKLIPVV